MTPKQLDLVRFLHRRHLESSISPSYDEMRAALGLKSKSGVHRLLAALDEQGLIHRFANRARRVDLSEAGVEAAKRDHGILKEDPDYSAGFMDRQDGLPPRANGTPAYEAGFEAYGRVLKIFADAGFRRGKGGAFVKRMVIGAAS